MLIFDIDGANDSSHQGPYHCKFSRQNSKYFAIYPPKFKVGPDFTTPHQKVLSSSFKVFINLLEMT